MFPPPHYVLFEPYNDVKMQKLWKEYKEKHSQAEYDEIDAAYVSSSEVFLPQFENIITKRGSKPTRIILIWHSEFLTFATQQMIRRLLETRSFKCRVWFHTENFSTLQSAIQSRCIIKKVCPLLVI